MFARGVLRLRPDNLVERPWGGTRLFDLKGLGMAAPGRRYGESFEVSADPADSEAAAHPSVAVLPDGRERRLSDLLAACPEPIVGRPHVAALGPRIPLLPKFLDIREMLSLQTHPPGNPEAYVILQAEPGATIRLGLRPEVDRARFAAQLLAGRAAQERLLERAGDPSRLEARLGPWLTARAETAAALARELTPDDASAVEALLLEVARVHRLALDALHEIPVAAGNVVFNATSDGRSAEAHALGNPEGRGIVLFEIRRTGPTLRLWDHARLPLRPLQVAAALAALPAEAREGPSYIAEPRPLAPGVWQSIVCPAFTAVHLRPARAPIARPALGRLRTLHVLRGTIVVEPGATVLRRGESAVVPVALGAYRVLGVEAGSEAVEVSLPAA